MRLAPICDERSRARDPDVLVRFHIFDKRLEHQYARGPPARLRMNRQRENPAIGVNAIKLLLVELEHLTARQNRLACTDVIVEMCKIVENPVTWQIDHRRRAAIDHVIIR